MTGDTTADFSGARLPPLTPNSEVYPNDWPDAAIWSVNSHGTSYDIASFKVQVSTYVPVS
jgi:hypothetical protein